MDERPRLKTERGRSTLADLGAAKVSNRRGGPTEGAADSYAPTTRSITSA